MVIILYGQRWIEISKNFGNDIHICRLYEINHQVSSLMITNAVQGLLSYVKEDESKYKYPAASSYLTAHNYISPEYLKNINEIRKETLENQWNIQSRYKTCLFKFLTSKQYFSMSKLQSQNKLSYPVRLSFFNGGIAQFPYDMWSEVYKQRSKDILAGKILYDNEFAYSQEGVKLFFELDYRSEVRKPHDDTIIYHVALCKEVVSLYFQQNENIDLSVYVLDSKPKLKYTDKSKYPIIAFGIHVVFPNIVINCEQGKQLCYSLTMRFQSQQVEEFHNVVDSNCYKSNIACLRPMFGRKLDICLSCMNDDELRLTCEQCQCRGKVSSGSYYTLRYMWDSNDQPIIPSDMRHYVKDNIESLLQITSIIPPKLYDFTEGYQIPKHEPCVVPNELKSTRKCDKDKVYVYKDDRCNQRLLTNRSSVCITDNFRLSLIISIIRNIHKVYDSEYMLLADVTKTNDTIFVDLKGAARSFCRVKNALGIHHKSNRVYFRISRKEQGIYQYCYDDKCRSLLKKKETKRRVYKFIDSSKISLLFNSYI